MKSHLTALGDGELHHEFVTTAKLSQLSILDLASLFFDLACEYEEDR